MYACVEINNNARHVARKKGPADGADGAAQGELPRGYQCTLLLLLVCPCLCIMVLAHPSTEPTSMAIVVT